jgi:hypothetical protein
MKHAGNTVASNPRDGENILSKKKSGAELRSYRSAKGEQDKRGDHKAFRSGAADFTLAGRTSAISFSLGDGPARSIAQARTARCVGSPIALYPDTLLAEILMASTYPLEIVEAGRCVDANKDLTGDALKAS